MNLAHLLGRWTMRTIHASILAAALIGSANFAFGQPADSAGSKVSAKHITNGRCFDVPVDVPQEHRLALSEIGSYVRMPTTQWRLYESMPNPTTRSNYKINEDGESWRTLVVADKARRTVPADLNLEASSQHVVIDAVPPVIQSQPVVGADGDLPFRCRLKVAHPNHVSLKATYKTPSGLVLLDMVRGQPGDFRVRATEASQYPVVTTARDFAGNVVSRDVNSATLVAAKTDIAHTSSNRPSFRDTLPVLSANRNDLPMPRIELLPMDTSIPTKANRPGLPSSGISLVDLGNVSPKPTNYNTSKPNRPEHVPNLPTNTTVNRGTPHPLINTEHASIEYRIDQVGPSGVGKVEIYMTTNNGQSWHRLGEDADKRSPADIKLPGDGVYGIRIVVTNGNGFGGRAPVAGDAPHGMIEVDTTSPFAQLRSAEILPSSGQVEIRWNASDKNLGAEPVTLSYRTRTDGPWQPIARGIKNDGLYRWAFPRDAGAQFYFKVEVADQASNIAHDTTRQPIVIDTTEPSAIVLTVTGSGTRPNVGGN